MDTRRWMAVAALVALVIGGALIWRSADDKEASRSRSAAFCTDLRSGLTPLQILGSSVKTGTYTPRQAADRAYGFAASSCPGELKTNADLRSYLQRWGIDPDA